MPTMRTGGLQPTAPDWKRRKYSLTRNFGAPSLDLPKSFSVKDKHGDLLGPREQGANMCTAMTISEIGTDEHGIKMDENWQAAIISLINGRPIHTYGADFAAAMKSGTLFGFLPKKDSIMSWQTHGEAMVCDWTKWPEELKAIAKAYRLPAYFSVDGPYDAFDNMRAQLYQHKPNNGIALGIPWYESFNRTGKNGMIPEPEGAYTWHAVDLEGFTEKNGGRVIRVRSWDGKLFGDSSYGYFTRDRFNKTFGKLGSVAFMYKDVSDGKLDDIRQQKVDLMYILVDLYYKLLFKVKYGFSKAIA